jgi:hypothetical protein
MAVQKMLSRYSLAAERDFENALKKIIQEIALHGLWRAKFFEKTAYPQTFNTSVPDYGKPAI